MAVTTVNTTSATLVASTSVAAAGVARGSYDLRTTHGGLLTAKITNGTTGPTIQCTATVYISHASGTTPAAAGEGADWKTYCVLGGGGSANNAVTPMAIVLPPCNHVQIEFTGHTGQAVTVESFLTAYTSLGTV